MNLSLAAFRGPMRFNADVSPFRDAYESSMHRHLRTLAGLWLLLLAAQLHAQDPAAEAPPEPEVVVTDPIAQAVVESRPSEPEDLVRAIKTLLNVKQGLVARRFIRDLLQKNLDDAALDGLYQRHGRALFVRLASDKELQPLGGQLSAAVYAAVEKQAQNPERREQFLRDLQDPSAFRRDQAMRELLRMGAFGLEGALAVLSDPDRADEHLHARAAVVAFGAGYVEPLLAVFTTEDVRLQSHVARVFGHLGAKEALPALLAPALDPRSPAELREGAQAAVRKLFGRLPTAEEAAEFLALRAQEFFDQQQTLGRESGSVFGHETWTWLPEERRLKNEILPLDTARALSAVRFARAARRLAPDHPALRRRFAAALLEAQAYAVGLGGDLAREPGSPAEEAAALGAETLNQVLEESLRTDHPVAAAAAAGLLGEIGSAELVLGGGETSPLAAAARNKDPRVRFAASRAIVRLNVERPYGGASYVQDALTWCASSLGVPRALVVANSAREAATLAALLGELGFEADIATDTPTAFRMLMALPDYEILLAAVHLNRPRAFDLLDVVRSDHRTATLPVAVFATAEQLPQAERLVRLDRRATAIVIPADAAGLQGQLEPFWETIGRERIGADERRRWAEESLGLLARLVERPESRLYDLRRLASPLVRVLPTPGLGDRAAQVLGGVGSPLAQQALADLASDEAATLETRRIAVGAFIHSLERFGILLTRRQVERQYVRYNESRTSPPEVQEVLGAVLDGIEERIGARVGEAAPPAADEKEAAAMLEAARR